MNFGDFGSVSWRPGIQLRPLSHIGRDPKKKLGAARASERPDSRPVFYLFLWIH